MESKSDTSAQPPILDREVSNVESLVIIFHQSYRVWKVAAKANWKKLEQDRTEATLRNILSTNEDGRLEVIQAFDVLHQTVPQQITRRRADTCVSAANAVTKYVYRRLDGEEVDAAEVSLQYLWKIESGSVLRSASSVSRRSVTSLGSGASRLKAAKTQGRRRKRGSFEFRTGMEHAHYRPVRQVQKRISDRTGQLSEPLSCSNPDTLSCETSS